MPPDPAPARLSSRPARPLSRWIPAAGFLLLLVHIAFFTGHTDRSARAFDACAVPPNTIAGLPEPRFFPDNDPYAWLSHTRDLMASDGWRIRWTFMDNAPYGREMHWSHPLIWTLRGMATGIIAATGWPAARAVELAGVWVMPLFQFLFLALAGPLLARRLGWLPAGLFGLMALTLGGFANAFHPLLPDHHGLQLATALMSFVCLQLGGMGWTRTGMPRPPDGGSGAIRPLALPLPAEARRWFFAAGILGGLALWLGATVWLFGLALTALAAATVFPGVLPLSSHARYQPALWRVWAWSGAAVAAAAWLLEYAPSHFAMRLEVNHPLFWLCWFGVAECLCFAGGGKRWTFWRGRRAADWIRVVGGVSCAAALPAAVLFGPAEWHHLHDPLLQRLHAGFITEFQPGWAALVKDPAGFLFTNFGFLPLFAAAAAGSIVRSRKRPEDADVLLRPAVALAVLYVLLMLLQIRWGFFAAGTMIWLTVLLLADGVHRSRRLRTWTFAAVGILLLQAFVADALRLRLERRTAVALEVPSGWLQASLAKRRALQWGLAAGTNQWRMVGLATEAPMLYYYAGIRTVASYYWENADGWHDETDFFADDPGGRQAVEIAAKRNLTHAFIQPSDFLPRLYMTIHSGTYQLAALRQTLGGRLAGASEGPLPAWIRRDGPLSAIAEKPYTFRTPEGLIGELSNGRVFRLTPSDMPAATSTPDPAP